MCYLSPSSKEAKSHHSMAMVQVTHDVTDLTFASFLSEVGKKTDLTARFSTVVHERGSSETMRDVRGFSVKVRTVREPSSL